MYIRGRQVLSRSMCVKEQGCCLLYSFTDGALHKVPWARSSPEVQLYSYAPFSHLLFSTISFLIPSTLFSFYALYPFTFYHPSHLLSTYLFTNLFKLYYILYLCPHCAGRNISIFSLYMMV